MTHPCVPGHEIVGKVVAVGAQVKQSRVGDYAGVGCMVDACGNCENCLQGTTLTYNSPDKACVTAT